MTFEVTMASRGHVDAVAGRMEFLRRSAAESRVGLREIVVGDPPANPGPSLGTGFEGIEVDALSLSDCQRRSMNTLSIHRPRPSMEIRTPASSSTLVKRGLTNSEP